MERDGKSMEETSFSHSERMHLYQIPASRGIIDTDGHEISSSFFFSLK